VIRGEEMSAFPLKLASQADFKLHKWQFGVSNRSEPEVGFGMSARTAESLPMRAVGVAAMGRAILIKLRIADIYVSRSQEKTRFS